MPTIGYGLLDAAAAEARQVELGLALPIEARTTRSTGQTSPRGAALLPGDARRQPLGDALRRQRGSTSASSTAAPRNSPASATGKTSSWATSDTSPGMVQPEVARWRAPRRAP